MKPVLPYATRLRIHLTESRARGMKWEQAWPAAIRAEVYQAEAGDIVSGSPWPMEYTKRVFRDGYLRLTAGSSVGALAERDYARPSNTDPEPPPFVRRCGWGGSRCEKPGSPWLCVEHGAIVAAIPRMCGFPRCVRDTPNQDRYCAKHAYAAKANQRGSDARSARQAA